MADLTIDAVASLLGLLGKAIKEEATLLSGLEGDIEFIRDEMDSMNGFLMHVAKKTPHDDQLRAWMKQVRDVTYVADDCIKLYMRDLTPPKGCGGLWAKLLHYVPEFIYLAPHLQARHDLAEKLQGLKNRVREVGERRHRYDVKIPEGDAVVSPPVSQDSKMKEEREQLLAALEDGQPPFEDAVRMFRSHHHPPVDAIVKMLPAGDNVHIIKMLLRSLYAHPHGAKEVENLLNKCKEQGEDVTKQVMIFCYSKLSIHYKSCLQYLTTFKEEESISRTCLVRRWLAEGLVAKDEQEGVEVHSMEEAGERCFDELVFRGFISRAPAHNYPRTGGLKLKRCILDGSIKNFIDDMSRSENFVADLPTHLRRQINIRKMARRQPPREQPKPWGSSLVAIGLRRILKAAKGDSNSMVEDGRGDNDLLLLRHHPMDEMVTLLKGLPKEYRLNVLDLGGCHWLKTRHLEGICKWVPSLKYLSLRKTNVSWLPAKEMNKLLHLETLDIRDTGMGANAMKDIFLQDLKHLLAGHIITETGENDAPASRLSTVLVPPRMGKNTEILRHVQVKDGREAHIQLSHVASLEGLRKLGVVLNGREDNIKFLLTTIARRSETLRSLSVWIGEPTPEHIAGGGVFVTLDTKGDNDDGAPILFSRPSKLESLNLKCFKGRKNNTGYIPEWIKRLENLSKITLRDSLLTEEGLSELGKMKNLRCLKLCHDSYIKDMVTLKKDEFKELRLLVLDQVSGKMTKLEFQEDAAGRLEKIVWNFHGTTTSMEITEDNISGIPKLKNLKEVKMNGVNILKPPPRDCN